MSDDPEQLAARYGASLDVVSRGGAVYPAAVLASSELTFSVASEPVVVDRALAAGGEAHLARVRAEVPWMYDGTVLSLVSVSSSGVVRAAPSSYFDRIRTGDALRAEPGDALRDRADALAGGDPLRSGLGRAAGFGVTVVATVMRDGRRQVVMGRRSGLPIGAGTWHVVPAGMAEPHPSAADAFRATAVEELSEELGVTVGAGSLRLLGLGFDLLRLLPEVIFTVELPDDADAVLLRAPRDEHDVLQLHAVDGRGRVPTVWAAHPPHRLAAPGAAALALFEESGA